MKKSILTLVLLFVFSSAFAGGPYFCDKAGLSLYYERYEAESGKLLRTTQLDFVSVRQEDGGQTVEYEMLLSKPNGRPLYGDRALLTTEIAADGEVLVDLSANARMVLKNIFPSVNMDCVGAAAVLPAGMRPGDRLPDAHGLVTAAGLKYTIDLTEREVLRTERLSTPAGVFDCMVERECKEENGPMYNRKTWSVTWYAEGIGYIRHDTYDKKMNLLSSEVLTRIDTH